MEMTVCLAMLVLTCTCLVSPAEAYRSYDNTGFYTYIIAAFFIFVVKIILLIVWCVIRNKRLRKLEESRKALNDLYSRQMNQQMGPVQIAPNQAGPVYVVPQQGSFVASNGGRANSGFQSDPPPPYPTQEFVNPLATATTTNKQPETTNKQAETNTQA